MIKPLKLVHNSHPYLRQKAETVVDFDHSGLKELCTAMLGLMNSHNAFGLAAPQVKVLKRIFVTKQKPHIWINPVLVDEDGTSFNKEGCLSFPGVFYKIHRAQKISVSYQDIEGNGHIKRLDAKKGFLSIVVQHEIDHLNGIVFKDRLHRKE